MATPTLPTDIITDILLRLQVKPLLRFTSVSESWYSLINSPKFIKLHLIKTLTSDNHPNLLISHYTLSSAVIGDAGEDLSFSDLDHPLKHLPPVQILGSCNGVVLISDYRKYNSVCLYNPSNKTHRLLPPFKPSSKSNPILENINDPKNANMVVFGLGYDSVSDDYKVLRVIETRKNYAVVYRETAVYSLKSDSWKCVECVVDEKWRNVQPINGWVFNECLHLTVADDFCTNFAIKSFNLGTEKFSIFNIPEVEIGRCNTYTGQLGGYLCLGFNYMDSYPFKNENGLQTNDEKLVKSDIWVMKEYGKEESWVKLYTISPAKITGCSRWVRPVVYSKDRHRLLLEVDGYWFGWYDIEKNKFKRIKTFGMPSMICESWTFVDNLVSLCRHKGKWKNRTTIKKNDFLSSGFKLKL